MTWDIEKSSKKKALLKNHKQEVRLDIEEVISGLLGYYVNNRYGDSALKNQQNKRRS